MLATTGYEIGEGRRRRTSACGNSKRAAQPHFDGYPAAGHDGYTATRVSRPIPHSDRSRSSAARLAAKRRMRGPRAVTIMCLSLLARASCWRKLAISCHSAGTIRAVPSLKKSARPDKSRGNRASLFVAKGPNGAAKRLSDCFAVGWDNGGRKTGLRQSSARRDHVKPVLVAAQSDSIHSIHESAEQDAPAAKQANRIVGTTVGVTITKARCHIRHLACRRHSRGRWALGPRNTSGETSTANALDYTVSLGGHEMLFLVPLVLPHSSNRKRHVREEETSR